MKSTINLLRRITLIAVLLACMLATGLLSGCGSGSVSDAVEHALTSAESVQESEEAADYQEELVEAEAEEPKFDWDDLYTSDGFRFYENEDYSSKVIIDFSKAQTVTSWKKLKKSGIDGIILKIGSRGYTEGSIIEDSHFASYYKKAVKNDIPVYGVYFFSQAISEEEAQEEADSVVKMLSDAKVSKDVVVFYDLETGVSSSTGVRYRNYDLSNSQIKKNLKTFASTMEENGYATGVYTSLKWHGRKLKRSLFKGYPLWYAYYQEKPNLKRGLTIWQYSAVGKVSGIAGHVDLNLLLVKK